MSDTDYAEFFLGSSSRIVRLELFEISHPNFSKVYRLVRNATKGITVTLEDDTEQTFEYRPIRVTQSDTRDNLDYSFKFEFGDTGSIVPQEIDNVIEGDGLNIRPIIKYRIYRSDQLTAPLFGPIELECTNIAQSKQAASFTAGAPSLNSNKTGLIYNLEDIPMLAGFL